MSPDLELCEARVGTTLRGKWTLEKLLGMGGMAAVYLARHKIGRRDAIKILHPDIAADKELSARFEQEAHAVNRFRHPGAVSILDIDVAEDGAPFLVMELLSGESLEARLERMEAGPLPVADGLRLVDELLDVLVAAHENGIVHRDLKPDNLFLLPDGHLKVLDFGIARMREGAPKTLHTRVGLTIGTLSYMSPEQVAGDAIDGRTDLFAVGCILFRLASGRLPHDGANEIELMVKMGMEPAPPLASIVPFAPPGYAPVVDRALAFDKDRRYPDAATMQADVRAVRAGQPPPYATAKIAAGELPNPPEATRAAPVSAAAPLSVAAFSAAAPVSMAMSAPMRAMAPPSAVSPTVSQTSAPLTAVPITAPMGPSPADRSAREKQLAAIAVGFTMLLLGVAIAVWISRRHPPEEAAADVPITGSASASAVPIVPGADDPSLAAAAPPGPTPTPRSVAPAAPQPGRPTTPAAPAAPAVPTIVLPSPPSLPGIVFPTPAAPPPAAPPGKAKGPKSKPGKH